MFTSQRSEANDFTVLGYTMTCLLNYPTIGLYHQNLFVRLLEYPIPRTACRKPQLLKPRRISKSNDLSSIQFHNRMLINDTLAHISNFKTPRGTRNLRSPTHRRRLKTVHEYHRRASIHHRRISRRLNIYNHRTSWWYIRGPQSSV